MDASIRVSNQSKQIEVNDNGDCIALRLGDADFTEKLVVLMREASSEAEELSNALPGNSPDEILEFTRKSKEACARYAAGIDEVFGDSVCEKVFGGVCPDFAALSEFFTKIAELIKQFETERREESRKRIEKYTKRYARGNSAK